MRLAIADLDEAEGSTSTMLVLLITMMLIAPMIHSSGRITLPEAADGSQKPDVQGQTVAIDSRGMFYVNAIPVVQTDLVSRVRQAIENSREKLST